MPGGATGIAQGHCIQVAHGVRRYGGSVRREARQNVPDSGKRKEAQASLNRCERALRRAHEECDELQKELMLAAVGKVDLDNKVDAIRARGEGFAQEKGLLQQELATFCAAQVGVGAAIPAAVAVIRATWDPLLRPR